MNTVLSGSGRQVVLGIGEPTVIVGNRIDASAHEVIADAVRRMEMELIQQEARAQAEAGADVIGIRLGRELEQNVEAFPAIIKSVTEAVPLPVCIRTRDPRSLEAALQVCPGKPLVDAITAEDTVLQELLPLVVKHQPAVIGIGVNENGLPREFHGLPIQFDLNLELTRLVVRKMLSAGVPREDIVVGIRPRAVLDDSTSAVKALELIECISRIEQLNIAIECGHVTYGLLDPQPADMQFISLAVRAGTTCCIADASAARQTVRTVDLLMNRSGSLQRYQQLAGQQLVRADGKMFAPVKDRG